MKTRDNKVAKLPLYYVSGGQVKEFTDETHYITGGLVYAIRQDSEAWPIGALYATRHIAYDYAIEHWESIRDNAEDRLRELRRERR